MEYKPRLARHLKRTSAVARELLTAKERIGALECDLAECRAKLAEAERQWTIHGTERMLLEQARYTPGGELDQMTALRRKLAEAEARCERMRGALEAVAEEFAHWPNDERVWIDLVRAALAGKELET